ncbi:MAG: hypothetical protein WEB58_21780 [Planctomycetaceae bacterium]
MLRAEFKWAAALLLWGLTGCQCSVLTRYYADAVDDVSDYDLEMDAFYRPTWDLNRIGKPDWCQSAFNRFWCRCHGCDAYCDYHSLDHSTYYDEELDADDRPVDGDDGPAPAEPTPPPYDEVPPAKPVAPPQPPRPIEAGAVPADSNQNDDLTSAYSLDRPTLIGRSAQPNFSKKSTGDGIGRSRVFSTQTPLRMPSPNIFPVI